VVCVRDSTIKGRMAQRASSTEIKVGWRERTPPDTGNKKLGHQ